MVSAVYSFAARRLRVDSRQVTQSMDKKEKQPSAIEFGWSPTDPTGERSLRGLAIFLLVSGVSVIACGITRWISFRDFVKPEDDTGEGDPRFFTAGEHMIITVAVGVAIVVLAGYVFGKAKQRSSSGASRR